MQDRNVEEYSPREVYHFLKADSTIVLLDVRERDEYELCRIKGAVLIPLSEIEDRKHELGGIQRVIAYCHHGMRSYAAAGFLMNEGFPRVDNMRGGIESWSQTVDRSIPRY